MDALAILVALALASVLLVGLGERLRLPWPALMVVLAAVGSLLPVAQEVPISEDLILPLFLPPLLFAAAQRTSWAMFRARWRAVVGLALLLTVVTIAAVAGTVAALVPGVSVAAAVAIAAAVAPPDPIAAEAVAGPLGIPRRIVSALQSEGLFNDAVAIVVFHAAVGSLANHTELGPRVVLDFVVGLVLAGLLGLVVAWVADWLTTHLTLVAARNALRLVLPFAVYLIAEELGVSGVIAVVVAALQMGSAQQVDAVEDRLTGKAFWDVVELLVTGMAFGLIGVELRYILDTSEASLGRLLGTAAAVCGVVVVVRAAWMTLSVLAVRRSGRRWLAPRTGREALVMTWCGMRGLATLALALAIPRALPDGTPLPGYDQLVVTAVAVLVVTLILPAFTLRALVRALGVVKEGDEENLAEQRVAQRAKRAAAEHLHNLGDGELSEDEATRIRVDLARLDEALPGPAEEYPAEYAERVREAVHRREEIERRRNGALAAARAEVLRMRGEPGVDPEAVDAVLRELDLQTSHHYRRLDT
ncbi:cation:proton antiporter [Georgenia thermotolerans]|uniref:Na+/H+ antiporter n=1 Tax=Georgenia thermotolerans TaxID=527326 RepID=A0A7J5URZ1_9MICO|nr:cation:proton antiporter [Georgenia thermotolerans]KAE8765010.1 Na+/H+ antiporter [Georgenia thermotolerans]